MTYTASQYEQRAARYFGEAAGETVEVRDYEDGEVAAFCLTELGMYRLADKYSANVVSKGYSKNLDRWYVTMQKVI